MRFLLSLLLTIYPLMSQAMDNNNQMGDAMEYPSNSLLKATDRYLELIHQISQGKFLIDTGQSAAILAPDCRKIFNGKLYTQNREDFIADLLEVNRVQGCWHVVLADRILSAESRCVVLRLMIEMENVGAFTAIVILRFNEDNLISEINEVFNRVEGVYNF